MRLTSLAVGITVSLLLAAASVRADGTIVVTLSGDWKATTPDASDVTYNFATDGTLTWHVSDPKFTRRWPNGLKAKYTVTVAKPFWLVDVFDFDDAELKPFRLRGIIEITDGQTFKMEGQPSNQGERPEKFGTDALVFHARKEKPADKTPSRERKSP
jgi:hypothetical protein